jgi:hypothetical protein
MVPASAACVSCPPPELLQHLVSEGLARQASQGAGVADDVGDAVIARVMPLSVQVRLGYRTDTFPAALRTRRVGGNERIVSMTALASADKPRCSHIARSSCSLGIAVTPRKTRGSATRYPRRALDRKPPLAAAGRLDGRPTPPVTRRATLSTHRPLAWLLAFDLPNATFADYGEKGVNEWHVLAFVPDYSRRPANAVRDDGAVARGP